MIILLRVGIGWHFFYEGVAKFDPASNFSAEGFLGTAKGPTAELYYWMLPDFDGILRLEMAQVETGRHIPGTYPDGRTMRNPDGTTMIVPESVPTFIVFENAWKEYFKQHLLTYHSSLITSEELADEYVNLFVDTVAQRPGTPMTVFADWIRERVPAAVAEAIADMNTAQVIAWSQADVPFTGVTDGSDVEAAKKLVRAKIIFNRSLVALRADALDFEEEIAAFKASRERFLETRRTLRNNASFEQERRWRQMMNNRFEAGYFTWSFRAMGDNLQSELGRLVDLELAGRSGSIVTAPERALFPVGLPMEFDVPEIHIPVVDVTIRGRMDVLNWAVAFGLAGIGLFLILGLCTRLACLAGVVFLVNVMLTTWPVPGVYPEIPPMMGNFMFVSKDMVELLALLFLMMVPAGRWGGLDYFLWNYGGKQFVGLFCVWQGVSVQCGGASGVEGPQ